MFDIKDLKIIIKDNTTEKDFLEAGFEIDRDPDYEDTYVYRVLSKETKAISGNPLLLGTIFREVSREDNLLLVDVNKYAYMREWSSFVELFKKWEETGFMIGYKGGLNGNNGNN